MQRKHYNISTYSSVTFSGTLIFQIGNRCSESQSYASRREKRESRIIKRCKISGIRDHYLDWGVFSHILLGYSPRHPVSETMTLYTKYLLAKI